LFLQSSHRYCRFPESSALVRVGHTMSRILFLPNVLRVKNRTAVEQVSQVDPVESFSNK
jgi:hypothetical protein